MEDPYKTTFDSFDQVADLYQEKFMDLDLYNDTYDSFCGYVSGGPTKILELGCGPGNITRYLLQRRPEFEILATDVAPNMVKLAQQNNPKAKVEVLDCRELHLHRHRYDGIVFGFCLPYLAKDDVKKLLDDTYRLLNPKGILYVSCIEGDYSNSGKVTSANTGLSVYMYYYGETELRAMVEEKYDLLEFYNKKLELQDGRKETNLILVLRKKKEIPI